MSDLSNLIGLSAISKIRPGMGVSILAFIYLGFICSHSIIGVIIYLLLCIFLFWFIIILPRQVNNRQASWNDDPGFKASVKARREQEMRQNKVNKDNPYA